MKDKIVGKLQFPTRIWTAKIQNAKVRTGQNHDVQKSYCSSE